MPLLDIASRYAPSSSQHAIFTCSCGPSACQKIEPPHWKLGVHTARAQHPTCWRCLPDCLESTNFVSIARMPLCMGRAKPNPELESMAIEAHLRSAVACVRSDSCACADLDEVQSRQSRLLPGAPQDCTHSLGPATTARKGGLASEAILPHDMQATMTIKTKMLPGLLTCRMATCTCRKCPQQDQCKRLRNPSEQRLAECPDPSSFLDFLNDRLRTLMLTRQCQIAAS